MLRLLVAAAAVAAAIAVAAAPAPVAPASAAPPPHHAVAGAAPPAACSSDAVLSTAAGTAWQLCGAGNASSPSSCIPATVPGTVLTSLLAASAFPGVVDPFVDESIAAIPDISLAGPGFYSGTFLTGPLSADAIVACAASRGVSAPRLSLLLRGQNYRSTVAAGPAAAGGGGGGGAPLPVIPPVGAPPGVTQAVGMYRRFVFDLGAAPPAGTPLAVSISVAPPDHPGNASNTCRGCGQGGNHQLAQDVTSQYAGGWDWIVGCPDRNTGVSDDVVLRATGAVLVRDPVAATTGVARAAGAPADAPANVTAAYTVSLLNLDTAAPVSGVLTVTIPALGAAATASARVTLSPGDGTWRDVALPAVALTGVSLWWPHTLGTPTLYAATASFVIDGDAGPSDAADWAVGFRTVASAVDAGLGGRVFSVNGERVYLEGGNWIATDMFNRYNANASRYAAEVDLHAAAGLNLIRLWGGAGGHGLTLYAAGDAAGVFFMVEFWMSGDNNGRWAGSYSWPLDHALYLAAVEDTVAAVRGHASVLFFCAGNELYPRGQNPPPDIAAAMPDIVAAMDPTGRALVFSSMSNFTGADGAPLPDDAPIPAGRDGFALGFDPEWALAPMDGPYGMLDERRFFERNPGLVYPNQTRATNMRVAFQPELGSATCPEYESLARFLTAPTREALPPRGAAYPDANATWRYHAYIPFTNADGADTVYAFGPPANASEYALAAGLAQVAQYQALYEGFADAMWAWYGAVVLWKSQSPWPAFRGALYDSYLAPTGSLWGVRAATGGGGPARAPVHPQLNRLTATVSVVNRGLAAVPGPLAVTVSAWDIATGRAVLVPPMAQALPDGVPPASVARLPGVVAWPAGAAAGTPLLFRLAVAAPGGGGPPLASTDLWVSTLSPDPAVPQNFSALAAVRHASPPVPVSVTATMAAPAPGAAVAVVQVTVAAPAAAAAVAFGVRVSLRWAPGSRGGVTAATGFFDDRVLPAVPDAGYFAVVPGEARGVAVTLSAAAWAPAPLPAPADLVVRVDGWNVAPTTVPVAAVVVAAAG
jgi:mannosylglycoprotein endo-beta-mannosidase